MGKGIRGEIAIFGLKMGVGIRKTFKKFGKSSEKDGKHVQWRCINFKKVGKVGKKLGKFRVNEYMGGWVDARVR